MLLLLLLLLLTLLQPLIPPILPLYAYTHYTTTNTNITTTTTPLDRPARGQLPLPLLQLPADARLHPHVLVPGDLGHHAQAPDPDQPGGPRLPRH